MRNTHSRATTARWRRALSLVSVAAMGAGVFAPTSASAAVPGAVVAPVHTSMRNAALAMNVPALWNAGFTGKGADVAVIDTGVSPVVGLDGAGKLFHGPDLSFDSQDPALRYLDGFGHGTHMAGIIAGKDAGWTPAKASTVWSGIAPDAKILSVKVGDQSGAVDVTQVIAAIHWVVKHKNDNGLNVRVINLSFGMDYTGTDVLDSVFHDPLITATELAWAQGILVVAAAGNNGSSVKMQTPAVSPGLLAVGAVDTKNTATRADDASAGFSSATACGAPGGYQAALDCAAAHRPEAFAPGVSIEGLRVPGSFLDQTYPLARGGTRFFYGSGSSQATAMISGVASLLMSENPALKGDQVRAQLGTRVLTAPQVYDYGRSVVDAAKLATLSPAAPSHSYGPSGGGAIMRGEPLVYNGVALTGNKDIFGKPLDPKINLTSWVGGMFNGSTLAGTAWVGNKFPVNTWWNKSWAGTTWGTVGATGMAWNGGKWSGGKWSGGKWSGGKWSGDAWYSHNYG